MPDALCFQALTLSPNPLPQAGEGNSFVQRLTPLSHLWERVRLRRAPEELEKRKRD